ncbi:hypothetical protein BJ165DRAFT_3656 [Panaeolus papilionaceus]|nr:hypothetical protein BJ165DRAFT_3656 [Panaeolus papilionaceus]
MVLERGTQNCGTSYEYGRALGAEGPVSPKFPHADYSTGVAGATGMLHAITQRAEKGGSFVVDVALNYYSQWLINACSVYPPDIWESLRTSYPGLQFNFSDSMVFDMATTAIRAMSEYSDSRNTAPVPEMNSKGNDSIFREEFFEVRENKAIGKSAKAVKTVLNFVNGTVKPGYNVGFRGNGVDKARWPKDLMTEVVE